MFKAILIILVCTTLVYSDDPVIISNVFFHKLGSYRGFTDEGSEYQKTYFFSRYAQGSFIEARSCCQSYGMEFMTLDTLEEVQAVFTMADNHSVLRSYSSIWLYVDGITLTSKSTTDWYWTKTGKKISYKMPWIPGTPNDQNAMCLTIGRYLPTGKFAFDDGICNASTLVACQKLEFLLPIN